MAKRNTTDEFYLEVKKEFDRISNIREYGVLKYTKDWCLARLAKKYHRAPATIENIIFNRV